LDVHRHTGEYRYYRAEDGHKRISEWVELEKGKHYYIEGDMQEGGGSDHFTVSVEIEQKDTKGHHHAVKEVQYLSVQSDTT